MLVAVALPLCKQLAFLPDPVIAGLAVVLGIAATVVYWRVSRLRAIVTVLAPIALISPAIYLFASPTAQLLFHRSAAATAAGSPGESRAGGDGGVRRVFGHFAGRRRRPDRAVLYPNFAALASEATWFRNASSVAAETEAALPGILTGNLPQAGIHEMDLHEYPHNLFTLLRESHKFSAFEPCTISVRTNSARSLSPPEPGYAVEVAVDRRGGAGCDPDPAAALAAGDARRFRAILQFRRHGRQRGARSLLRSPRDPGRLHRPHQEQPGAKPGLFFIHSVLPHSPWVYLPSGKQYNLEGLPPQIRDSNEFTLGVAGLDRQSKHWLDDAVVVAQAQQRYLLQVQFVDRELGRLFRHLKEVGLYDRSLIVITADHGVSFVPGQPFRGICQEIYPETLSVPLFIKLPGQHAGRASDRNVEAVDILPTMADVLKIRLPWTTRGSSALDDRVAAAAGQGGLYHVAALGDVEVRRPAFREGPGRAAAAGTVCRVQPRPAWASDRIGDGVCIHVFASGHIAAWSAAGWRNAAWLRSPAAAASCTGPSGWPRSTCSRIACRC